MKTASYAVFQENRAKFPLEELRKYDGQWVAFSSDGRRILAGAATIVELAQKVNDAGETLSEMMIEHIELESSMIYLGAAELS
jgi:hypothetical protein